MNALRTALTLGIALATASQAPAQTTRVSVDSSGLQADGDNSYPAISLNGQFVAFTSNADNLVAGDTNATRDTFVHDRTTGFTKRVSIDSFGAQANGRSDRAAISSDGQVVAFSSIASNLILSDNNGYEDVFVHDFVTGATEIVSVDSSATEGDFSSILPSISADGRFVVFYSDADNLVAGDTGSVRDLFVHDRTTGITERASVDSSGSESNGDSGKSGIENTPAISADGQVVAFDSVASNLVAGDTNGSWDVFVHDRSNGVTECVSIDSQGNIGNGDSLCPSLSADGRFVAFFSNASNLVPGDTNSFTDVFVHDRQTGITERVSVDSAGGQAGGGHTCTISANGESVAFWIGSDVFPGDANSVGDVFVHDRTTGVTELVSVDSSGLQGNDNSGFYGISMTEDGREVAFWSSATNLVAADTNTVNDVFSRARCVDASWTNYGSGFPGKNGVPTLTAESNPDLGTTLTLDLSNSSASFTAALVFVGFQQTQFHSGLGGDVLVVPALSILVGLPPSGTSLTGALPSNEAYCGLEIDLQAIEADAGAAKGVSFTQGIELVLGE